MKYRITVEGCDDKTFIDMDLTDGQAKTIKEVAHRITEASEYS